VSWRDSSSSSSSRSNSNGPCREPADVHTGISSCHALAHSRRLQREVSGVCPRPECAHSELPPLPSCLCRCSSPYSTTGCWRFRDGEHPGPCNSTLLVNTAMLLRHRTIHSLAVLRCCF
jgi:hypothetical protein